MSMYRHVRNRLVERDTIISIDDLYAFLKEEEEKYQPQVKQVGKMRKIKIPYKSRDRLLKRIFHFEKSLPPLFFFSFSTTRT